MQLDAPILNVAHFLGSQVETALLADAIGVVAAEARALDRRVTIEFLPGTGIPDLQTAVDLVVAIAADNVSVMLDTWHHARSGGTVEQLRELPPRMVGGVQVSDRIEPPPGTVYRPMADRLLPGAGELPLAGILSAVLGNNPDIPVGVEVFSSGLRYGPPARCRGPRRGSDPGGPARGSLAPLADDEVSVQIKFQALCGCEPVIDELVESG